MAKKFKIEVENANVDSIVSALAEVNKGCKTGTLERESAESAVSLMEKYPGIKSLDVRGGERVARAYKYPHEATGFVLSRTASGALRAVVTRKTGNDLARWAIVSCSPEVREQLKNEIGLDQYNQID